MRPLLIGTLGRLRRLLPLVALTAAVLFGFRGMGVGLRWAWRTWRPARFPALPVAEQMGADGELAGELVVFTTALSIFTVFGFMYAMKSMGLI